MRKLIDKLVMMAVLGVCGAAAPAAADEGPRPPEQPEKGPGGSDYAHAAVKRTAYGRGIDQFWIFQPDKPQPDSAPLVLFNHGWSAMNPTPYEAWIGHIVRRGNIVVYPRYQARLTTPPRRFLPAVTGALKQAIRELEREGNVRPDLSRFSIVGHSVGGVLSANVAAIAKREGLPLPRAVMSVQPGKTSAGRIRFGLQLEDLSRIPAETLLLCLVGDRDRICGDRDARRILSEATSVKAANKNLIIMQSDTRGDPPLMADHFAPLAGSVKWAAVNTLDYYGTWKLFDALCDAGFHDGRNREYALGDTKQQRNMGTWSDGVAVKEMKVEKVDAEH